MNDARREKLEHELAEVEAALRADLLRALPAVVESGSLLFVNSEWNPHGLLPHWIHPQAEDLLQQARACVALREVLALPLAGSVGEQFLTACAEAASGDEQRRGPRRLAEWLLGALREPR